MLKLRAALAFLALAFAGCAMAAPAVGEVTRFRFTEWDGPALRVFTVEPEGLAGDAPVVFVIHGVRRNAGTYRDNWIALARTHGLRVYAVEFSQRAFAGAAHYNLGSVGSDRRDRASAFDAIEPLFSYLQDTRGVTADGYILFGHSAGAQYVHRFTCFADAPRLTQAIAANAGWYTLPDAQIAWPYGLGGLGEEACDVDRWLSQPLLVMLGDQDNDPNAPNLRQAPEAVAQGPHRLARGVHFIQFADEAAKQRDMRAAWQMAVVRGVAHDNAGMANAAAVLIMAAHSAAEPAAAEAP